MISIYIYMYIHIYYDMPQEWYADGVATCSHRQVSAGIETGLDTTATLKRVT